MGLCFKKQKEDNLIYLKQRSTFLFSSLVPSFGINATHKAGNLWNWIKWIKTAMGLRESHFVTSEVARCAAKDDTEVEVVTYLLSSLPIPLAHVLFQGQPLHCIIMLKEKNNNNHTYMHASTICATTRGRRSQLKIVLSLQKSPPSNRPPLFTSHLITWEPCFRFSHEFTSWTACEPWRCTCFSEHIQPWRNTVLWSLKLAFFFFQCIRNNLWHPCVKVQNLFILLPLFLSLLSSSACIIPLFSSSFSWPQGAVSYLDAGALLWAVIDCPPSTASPQPDMPVSMGLGLSDLSASAQSSYAEKQEKNGESDGAEKWRLSI